VKQIEERMETEVRILLCPSPSVEMFLFVVVVILDYCIKTFTAPIEQPYIAE